MKIREKSEKKKNHRENFHYVNDDYNGVPWIRVNMISFSLEGILYLYKSCPIDKVKILLSLNTSVPRPDNGWVNT